MRGIYKIENKINGKVYIGESLDIERRWREHLDDLNNNKHHSYKLQDDWNKYGENSFCFEVISELDKTVARYIDRLVLVIYEDKYINNYNSIDDGYNIENTLDAILNKGKEGFNGQDKRLIIGYKEEIDKGELFVELNNIIYRNRYTLNFIEKRNKIEHIDLINLMLEKDMLVEFNKKDKYILNENHFNKADMIYNGKSGIAFRLNTYNQIITELSLT